MVGGKIILEKPLVGRFGLPRVRLEEKTPKSGAPAEIGKYHMYGFFTSGKDLKEIYMTTLDLLGCMGGEK